MKKLTDMQEKFCREYLVDLNASQAALRAGYSEKTAYAIGHEILHKPHVQKRLEELNKKRFKKVEIDAENVIRDIVETRTAAQEDGNHNARLKANELLGKYLSMFTDKTQIQNLGADGKPIDPPSKILIEHIKAEMKSDNN